MGTEYPTFDAEVIFQLSQQRKWPEVVSIVREAQRQSRTDDLTRSALSVFVQQIIGEIAGKGLSRQMAEVVGHIIELRANFTLSDRDLELLIPPLVRFFKIDYKKAADYAMHYPQHPECQAAIDRFKQAQEKFRTTSGARTTVVAPSKPLSDATCSLFKSAQEQAFFGAVRDVFPSHLAYPNVALSTVIDWKLIESRLGKKEQGFFFRGIIDCVVFDQANNYRPVYFFEIDSDYHDRNDAIQRDQTKERIINAAGRTLIRIRPDRSPDKREAFVTAIRDAIVVMKQ